MKTPKCPLCGTPLKAIRGYDVHGITTDWVAGCYNCFFQSSHFWKTKKACIEDMDRLVSLFPPIMRVENGDLIAFHTGNSIKIRKIQAIDKENCRLQTDIGIVYANAVWKWPWELEQKGGKVNEHESTT